MDLVELIDSHQEAITQAVVETYPPLYSARNRDDWGFDLRRLKRRPMGAQGDAIRALALSLQRHQGTNLVGEMGTGKTTIGVAAAYLAGYHSVAILCPPHLTRKWQREIVATVPGAHTVIPRSISDLMLLQALPKRPLFVVLSRESAKLSYRWKAAVVARRVVDEGRAAHDEDGHVLWRLCCPSCFEPVLDDEGLPFSTEELERKKRWCEACGGSLWQADRLGPRRYPLADYIGRFMPGFFDLLIVDEQQDYKAKGSAQGIAAGNLATACGKVLTLTGTLLGGYASTIFYLLWRFSPDVREEFGYNDEPRWISRYGIVERITKTGDDDAYEDGRSSRRRSYRTRTVEKPGISPALLFHLIGNSVFLRLADVATDLPAYQEEVRLVEMARSDDPAQPSQLTSYQRLASDLHTAVSQALARGSKRLLGAYLQALLAYPDACTKGETVLDAGEVVASVRPLPEDRQYPKEQALVDLIRKEKQLGRRVLVYISHTERRDISPRLLNILRDAGLRTVTLKADTVPPARREEWVERQVKAGLDALIVHPKLVQTGLDLIQFPTIAWYETEYSVYTMRQASRRSWRIGQTQPVQVILFAYAATLQAQALSLVAKKLKTSLALEGELVEDGLAGHDDDGVDIVLALARSLTEQVEASEESLEGLFAEVTRAAGEMEQALLAEDMTPEALGAWDEPEPNRSRPSGVTSPFDLPLFAATSAIATNGHSTNGNQERPEPELALPGQQLRLL